MPTPETVSLGRGETTPHTTVKHNLGYLTTHVKDIILHHNYILCITRLQPAKNKNKNKKNSIKAQRSCIPSNTVSSGCSERRSFTVKTRLDGQVFQVSPITYTLSNLGTGLRVGAGKPLQKRQVREGGRGASRPVTMTVAVAVAVAGRENAVCLHRPEAARGEAAREGALPASGRR